MTLHLVRHGRPLIRRSVPAAQWDLDPASYDDVWALRSSGRLPTAAAWFASPEPKAVQTAQLLTDGDVGILDDLREHERSGEWVDDFAGAVRRAFADPDAPAVAGWEPLATCRERVVPAVRRVLDVHGSDDVVLVGHGTAWTVVVAALTGRPPDLRRWESLAMPDVLTVEPDRRA
ncbi:histidine phosphatase family protein [Nocardioides sp. zg-1228]|uniref:histidine phosphatase family protein n=1 Tax=Nocardioides sp. zg-1228 TaxID=2763008 RepID=UPI001642457A|nr:histidine phosphatase family protein [Nocardioides sp. zg-1228]MBC2933391.1 histidine phosphatase family protein [Nocardioides sp. zg-1228]QSF56457.1 histidine phosphatase family protein [Nocardioides sp. zg-1228]